MIKIRKEQNLQVILLTFENFGICQFVSGHHNENFLLYSLGNSDMTIDNFNLDNVMQPFDLTSLTNRHKLVMSHIIQYA